MSILNLMLYQVHPSSAVGLRPTSYIVTTLSWQISSGSLTYVGIITGLYADALDVVPCLSHFLVS